jgi:hypothetical protein
MSEGVGQYGMKKPRVAGSGLKRGSCFRVESVVLWDRGTTNKE